MTGPRNCLEGLEPFLCLCPMGSSQDHGDCVSHLRPSHCRNLGPRQLRMPQASLKKAGLSPKWAKQDEHSNLWAMIPLLDTWQGSNLFLKLLIHGQIPLSLRTQTSFACDGFKERLFYVLKCNIYHIYWKKKHKVYRILLAVSRVHYNYLGMWSGVFSKNRDGGTFC